MNKKGKKCGQRKITYVFNLKHSSFIPSIPHVCLSYQRELFDMIFFIFNFTFRWIIEISFHFVLFYSHLKEEEEEEMLNILKLNLLCQKKILKNQQLSYLKKPIGSF